MPSHKSWMRVWNLCLRCNPIATLAWLTSRCTVPSTCPRTRPIYSPFPAVFVSACDSVACSKRGPSNASARSASCVSNAWSQASATWRWREGSSGGRRSVFIVRWTRSALTVRRRFASACEWVGWETLYAVECVPECVRDDGLWCRARRARFHDGSSSSSFASMNFGCRYGASSWRMESMADQFVCARPRKSPLMPQPTSLVLDVPWIT
ncbi:hypothetical protein DENSPDRAFT_495198 [Dentipellis sp. KUC8613]|nr:hypothetical protein DENSPDRAFT_495198 [Dentipellis sp. KUC8613]